MRRRQMWKLNQQLKPVVVPVDSVKGDTVIRIDTPQDGEMPKAEEKKLTAKKRGRPKKQEV